MTAPAWVAHGTEDGGNETTQTPGVPAGMTPGDYVGIAMVTANLVARAVPAGFTTRFQDMTANLQTALYRKYAPDPVDTGSYTVDTAATAATYQNGALAFGLTGVDPVTPSMGYALSAQGNGTGLPSNPGIAAVPADSLLLMLIYANVSGGRDVTTLPGGGTYTRRTPTGARRIHIATKVHDPGGSGTSDTGAVSGGVIATGAFHRVALIAFPPSSVPAQNPGFLALL